MQSSNIHYFTGSVFFVSWRFEVWKVRKTLSWVLTRMLNFSFPTFEPPGSLSSVDDRRLGYLRYFYLFISITTMKLTWVRLHIQNQPKTMMFTLSYYSLLWAILIAVFSSVRRQLFNHFAGIWGTLQECYMCGLL